MSNTALTIVEANNKMTAHEFKSDSIRKSVDEIIAAYGKATAISAKLKDEFDAAKDAAYKAIAPVLAKLRANNAHKTEGFKTWTEFVNATLPITDRQATTILTYQRKVSDVPALKDFTVSNVNELCGADNEALKKAIESKEITPETKQAALSDFAKAHKPESKARVEPRFNIWAVSNENMKFLAVNKSDFAAKMGCDEVAFLPAPKDGSPRRFIAYKSDGTCVMGAFVPYAENASKSPASNKSKYPELRAAFPEFANMTDAEMIAAIAGERAKQEQGK